MTTEEGRWLEGLDEQTERDRRDDFYGRMTDLPDAELTDDEREKILFGFGFHFYEKEDHTQFAQGINAVESILTARLAAASVSWAEQLDTANTRPECQRAYCAIFDDWQKIAAERDEARAELDSLRKKVEAQDDADK